MSIPVVQNFNRKSADKWASKGLPSIRKTLKQCLIDMQDYINETVDEFIGATTYDHKTVSDWIYKDTFDTTNITEREEFVKVNLYAAKRTFMPKISRVFIG